MRKILQIAIGNYTYMDESKEYDEQKYAVIILCDDNTIWQKKEGSSWENIDASEITNHIKPRAVKK